MRSRLRPERGARRRRAGRGVELVRLRRPQRLDRAEAVRGLTRRRALRAVARPLLVGAPALTRGARRLLNPLGLDVVRLRPSSRLAARRQEILAAERVDVALDVGAHVGSYARQLRAYGFRGRIVCFEPLSGAFVHLRSAAAGDERWECRQLALGREDAVRELRVARNAVSSSFLEPAGRLAEAAPRALPGETEMVETARLDSLRPSLLREDERVFLKADVQGLELEVLAGGRETLRQVRAIELELTLLPLYDGQPLATEAIAYLDERGYDLVAVADGFRHERTGQLLQLDGLFVRRRR